MSAELTVGTNVRIIGCMRNNWPYHRLAVGDIGVITSRGKMPDGTYVYVIEGRERHGERLIREVVDPVDLEAVATEDTSTAYKSDPLFEELLQLRAKLADQRERFPETDGHVVRARGAYMRRMDVLEPDQLRAFGEYVERATTIESETLA